MARTPEDILATAREEVRRGAVAHEGHICLKTMWVNTAAVLDPR